MTLDQYLSEADAIEREGTAALASATDADSLEAARVNYDYLHSLN